MHYQFGPLVEGNTTTFRLWAPSRSAVSLIRPDREPLPMKREGEVWAIATEARSGDRYKFRADGALIPDPASREQEADAGGWSLVRGSFGREPHPGPLRPWHETILCEVHVGTASPEGTYAGLMNRLDHFRDAGYTGIELMPLNDFPGRRGWGYDGVLPFAPDTAYGRPEELRALVDRAHDLGLCMIVDVVYNHFGPVGNYIPEYAPEWFDAAIKTPWGAAIDFRQPMVRQYYYENAAWWLREYDFDGLRFDAVHEIGTEARGLFLGELARHCRAVKPDAKLIIENIRNQMHWLTRNTTQRPMDFTAQWNDDFHHVMQFLVTGEKVGGYEDDSRDPVADLEKSLADGFVHDGDGAEDSDGRIRGEPASMLPMEAFVTFLQNHDQIGNRPDSKRIVDRVDAARLDFGHFVTLLNPQIPMFFMGEEAHLRSPFLFFFDLPDPVASEKRQDRYWQMEHVFMTNVKPGSLPDPQDEETFHRSRIDWHAYRLPEHRAALERFGQLTRLRRELIWPLTATPCIGARSARQGDGLIVTWQYAAGTLSMVVNPTDRETSVTCSLQQPAASTGLAEVREGTVLVGPWSALVWRS